MDLRLRRMDILRRVESGELNPEDGNRLLLELEERELEQPLEPLPAAGFQAPASGSPQAAVSEGTSLGTLPSDPPAATGVGTLPPVAPDVEEKPSPKFSGWRGWWVLPFVLGLLLTLFSVNWMYMGWVSAGLSWGFWLSFIPFALGIVVMWASWQMRFARWLHLHIRQRPGATPQVIAFSVPLPFGLTRWIIRNFGRFAPQVNSQDAVEILDELDEGFMTGDASHIFIDGADGQQVEIWIEGPAKK